MHRRSAHFSNQILRRTHKEKLCEGFEYDFTHHAFCDICPLGNSRVATLKGTRTRATQPCELVHVDLWGPSPVRSHTGNKYLIIFTDDYSRYSALYALSKKNSAVNALRKYLDDHVVPLGTRLKALQTDGGGEFLGSFADLCRINGTRIQLSAPDTQAQNSVAERVWGTIISSTIRLLQDAKLPATYFQDAAHTSVYIKNRIAHAALERLTPYEAMFNKKPNLSLLRVFGSPAYVHVHHRQKLDAKAKPCVFVGYSTSHRAWRFFCPTERKYFVSRSAIFNERIDDDTPTLTLLKQPQPKDLQLSELADGLSEQASLASPRESATREATSDIAENGSISSSLRTNDGAHAAKRSKIGDVPRDP